MHLPLCIYMDLIYLHYYCLKSLIQEKIYSCKFHASMRHWRVMNITLAILSLIMVWDGEYENIYIHTITHNIMLLFIWDDMYTLNRIVLCHAMQVGCCKIVILIVSRCIIYDFMLTRLMSDEIMLIISFIYFDCTGQITSFYQSS